MIGHRIQQILHVLDVVRRDHVAFLHLALRIGLQRLQLLPIRLADLSRVALKFLADMGLLLVMVMLINMIVALVLVPLLVWLIKPKFVASDKLLVGEGINLEDYVSGDEAYS